MHFSAGLALALSMKLGDCDQLRYYLRQYRTPLYYKPEIQQLCS